MSNSTTTAGVTPAPDLKTLLSALDHATPKVPLIATMMPELHEALTKKILGGASYRVLAKALGAAGLVVTAPELERVHRAAVERNTRRKLANKLKARIGSKGKERGVGGAETDTTADRARTAKSTPASTRANDETELQNVKKINLPKGQFPDPLVSELTAKGFRLSQFDPPHFYDPSKVGIALPKTLISGLKKAGATVIS